jgi:hypothetical protein
MFRVTYGYLSVTYVKLSLSCTGNDVPVAAKQMRPARRGENSEVCVGG